MNKIRHLGCFAALVLISALSASAQSYSLHVGEPQFLETPDPMYNGYVNSATWTTSGFNLSFSSKSEAGAVVYPNHYFEGTEYVTCVYTFTYYSGTTPRAGQSQKTFAIKCIPIYAKLSDNELNMSVGQKKRLSYTLSASGYNQTPEWTSSNEDVATVDKNGNVTALTGGNTTITLDPIVGPSVLCYVYVNSVKPTQFIVNSPLNVTVGKTKNITYSFEPSDASASISWTSEDKSIAKVSSSGVVTGVKEGSTRITGKTDNGLTAYCDIRVLAAPTGVKLPLSATVTSGYSIRLTPELEPAGVEAACTWSSSNTSIVSVDADGNVVGYNPGTADITIKTDNKLTAKCSVTVVESPTGADARNMKVRIDAIQNLINKTLK